MDKLLDFYQQHRAKLLFIGANLLFLLLIAFGLNSRSEEFVYLIPILLIFGTLAIENFRNLWYVLVFFLPVSMDLQNFVPGISMTLPTDLLCLGLVALIGMKMILERRTNLPFFSHPIFFVTLIWLGWMIIPAVASEMPLVSAKWIVAHLWLIGGFYAMSVLAFKNPKAMIYFFWLIAVAFIVVMCIIMMLYVSTGRNPFALRFNPMPFFTDHTVFGAFTSMLVPMFVLFTFGGEFSRTYRAASFFALLFVLMGLFFSYSRGAWASVVIGLFLMTVWLMRWWLLRLWPLVLILIVTMGIIVIGQMGNKRSASNLSVSRKSFTEHVGSIANWNTDYSNAERLNRWKCAWEMFKERPVLGYGPGTYAMVYGDFQLYKYRTPVSTNHADNGTAHNEWLLAIAETGLMGGITTLLLFIVPIWFGFRGYLRSEQKNIRLLYLGSTFGLITYFFHAMVNNFIDQDKVGGLFFGMLAIITALDIYRAQQKERGAHS